MLNMYLNWLLKNNRLGVVLEDIKKSENVKFQVYRDGNLFDGVINIKN